jgi:NAD(P)-dependent dehydrogenase (short-subunit alcohol dehydrogenase family)
VDELFDLTGKVAIITGSTQGIGRACAERLCQHGARVVFSSRTLDDCRARAAEMNQRFGEDRALAIECDLSEPAQIRALVARTADHWGRIDVVVANARDEHQATSWVEKIEPDLMTRWFVGNVTNNLVLAQAVVPVMRRVGEGSIVFNASTAGVLALEDYLPYGVAKAALIHMAKVLAVQLGPLHIRVNCVSPGPIAAHGLDTGEWADEEFRRVVTSPMPLGRPGVSDEVASAMVWLASPGSAFTTGQNIVIDGGQTLKGMHGPHDMFEISRARKRAQVSASTEPDGARERDTTR